MISNENSLLFEQRKIRNLIKQLEKSKGYGTSMISLLIPPKKAISEVVRMLNDEYAAANNIKCKVNRKSVLSAITSAREKLKLFNKTPPNGLVIYAGLVIGEDGKTEKNMSIHLETNRPHLKELLENKDVFGFIVVDGQGALYGTLEGSNKEIVYNLNVELPKKHNKGGQSSVRFSRLALENRHIYLKKVCEVATQVFITDDKPNVKGLILAGSADFKNDLFQSDLFDQRIKPKVLKIVDISCGGENGFNQAIDLAQECLQDVKFVQEKKMLSQFFDEVSMDSGLVVFGIKDTMELLEMNAIKTLVISENLDIWRVSVRNKDTGEINVLFLTSEQMSNAISSEELVTRANIEIVNKVMLLEWLEENYINSGLHLQFISDTSSEALRFIKGFGGVCGFLRYKIEIDNMKGDDDEQEMEIEFI